MTVLPLGDSAVVIALGASVDPAMAARVRAVAAELERHRPAGVTDIVPAFASVGLFFDPAHPPVFDVLREELAAAVARADDTIVSVAPRTVEVPVCYGGEFGPDLADIARRAKLSEAEAIALHAGADYLVHAIGFSPGFPYLGGLPPALAAPRRATPRPRVPAGSVGIGGAQTGIYPFATPGGWNLIGRTPLALFDPARETPALLRAGDRVVFRPISAEECRQQEQVERFDLKSLPSNQAAWGQAAPPSGIEILRPGLFTTVQDLGRRGWRASGVPLAGAADAFALRVANSLVGNAENAAGLECTLVGPELKFLHDTVVAFTGAAFADLPRWRPFKVAAGTVLALGPARSGCRGYLAVAGGIGVAPVLGSRSTYARAGLGGWGGRALHAGDVLPVATTARAFGDHWRIDERILPAYAASPTLRVVAGANAGEFDPRWAGAAFRVSSHSDRMGVRLTGEPLPRRSDAELVSSPVAPGTIQVPPDGQPIILLADAQTIGGYPQLAHVASVDLSLVAQLRPGDTVRFAPISLTQARELALAQERALALLREGLAQKLA